MSIYPRTHERLSRDITRDPIFLLQERRPVWHEGRIYGVDYDPEREGFVNDDGDDLTIEEAVEAGAGVWVWRTITVFLTREEGEAWAGARAYRYPHGHRVYCVPAEGAMCDVLANATEGGRYL